MNLFFRLILLLLKLPFRNRHQLLDEIQTNFICLPTDLDTNLHMNNGRFFSIMDLGRMDLIFSTGNLRTIRREKIHPVVVEETLRFRKSIELFQKFYLTTKIVGWKEQDIYIEQKFWVNGSVHAYGFVRGRMIKKGKGTLAASEIARLFGYHGPDLEVSGYAKNWSELSRSPQ